jgi:S1-C subfamily serine protease
VVGLVHGPAVKGLLALVALMAVAAVGVVAGRSIGGWLRRQVQRAHLETIDGVIGALLAGVAAVLLAWVLGSVLANVPTRSLAAQIQKSTILRHVDSILPPAPSAISRLQQFVNGAGLPQVFAQFEPVPAGSLPVPAPADVQAAVAHAGASTVKISGPACDETLLGSGFVVAPGIVVTNAHVIAGDSSPTVHDQQGSYPATPVFFDPNLDLAVLRVPGLRDPALDLVSGNVSRGTTAAVLGYPGGGPFDSEPAAVLAQIVAIGRNIYGQGLTDRSVYEIQSLVRPGNSGGPLVEPDGDVIGIVFSRSTVFNNVGYALTSGSVLPDITSAESRTAPVSTGPCSTE